MQRDSNGNLNESDVLDRNPENLVVRLCSEPQKGDLVRGSEILKNLDSSMCPLVHTNVTEKFGSNLRDSINLGRLEENLDVPCHTGDSWGTTRKSEQSNGRPIESEEFGELVSHSRNQENSVENSSHSRRNQENSRIYSIQNDSGMHSETFHSNDEDLETQTEEIELERSKDDSRQISINKQR